jgi:hypothetical protein
MKSKKANSKSRGKKLKSAKSLKGVKTLQQLNPQPLPPRHIPIS